LPGTKKALQPLQKRLFQGKGILTLNFDESFLARATFFLAVLGLEAACSNKATILALADAFCSFTSLLQRIKLYKHLVKDKYHGVV